MPPTQDRLIGLTYLAGDVVHLGGRLQDGVSGEDLVAAAADLVKTAHAALALPAPTAPKLLLYERSMVASFVVMRREDREQMLERLRRTPGTSGPLLIVLDYLLTA